MDHIDLNLDKAMLFLDNSIKTRYNNLSINAIKDLYDGTCKGCDFLGWLNLPTEIKDSELQEIEELAKDFRELDVVIVVGIGGSYLGAKSVISALSDSFDDYSDEKVKVIYAGHNLSEDYLYDLMQYLDSKRFGICVISKSGTTTEPAISFRLLKDVLEKSVGKSIAAKRIVVITDKDKGALRTLANQEGYKSFSIADNIGGRFSVFSPVGLFPIALAGFDIRTLINGAKYMQEHLSNSDYENNIAAKYASIRNLLYDKGFKIELFATFNPRLHFVSEWWKQLYGESEGKDHKGLFPASVDFTTDLHSMGQYIQDGERHLFETFVSVKNNKHKVIIPSDTKDLDNLNYISGSSVGFVNEMAEQGTQNAHITGGVPCVNIIIPKINEYYLGELIYFYEMACAISASLLDVNPFDQPGVEEYKKNMFTLLGKKVY